MRTIAPDEEHLIPGIIAEAHMRQIEQSLFSVPIEVLQEAKRRQDIEAHNAKVDEAKAKRKEHQALTRMVLDGIGMRRG